MIIIKGFTCVIKHTIHNGREILYGIIELGFLFPSQHYSHDHYESLFNAFSPPFSNKHTPPKLVSFSDQCMKLFSDIRSLKRREREKKRQFCIDYFYLMKNKGPLSIVLE